MFDEMVKDLFGTTILYRYNISVCLFAFFVDRNFKDTRNWNSPCSPHCSDISSQLPILWIAPFRCTLRCSWIPGQSPWTTPKFMQGLREFDAGGLPNVNPAVTWLLARIMWLVGVHQENQQMGLIPKTSTLLICHFYISAYSMQTWTFNSCTVDDPLTQHQYTPHLGDLPPGTPEQVPSVTDEAEVDTTRSCRKWQGGEGMIQPQVVIFCGPFQRFFSK